jgi:2-polyprenyl-6-hydroxyphenyl methylase/3-demethylubiquinone-9 3-methyltransferase
MSIRWKTAQALEWRWWLAYFKNKEKASYYKAKKAYWHKWLNIFSQYIPVQSATRVADLGCGPAGLYTILQNSSITAADPLLDEYEAQLEFFKKADYPHVNFITSTLENFQDDEGFDIVYCMNAINHVRDINLAFKKLVASTKSGGFPVVSIDAHNHAFFRYLFRSVPIDVLHPHQYNLEEYSKFLIDNGCHIKATITIKEEFLFNHIVLIAQKN